MVDTSFLITLANSERPNHRVARDYFVYANDNGVRLFLPTLVVMEFSRRQSIQALLHQFIVLPFNIPEAIRAGELAETLMREPVDDRKSVAIDIALLAQADRNGIRAILTEDAQTLTRYCDRLREGGRVACQTLLLSEGFDPSRLIDPAAPGLAFPPTAD